MHNRLLYQTLLLNICNKISTRSSKYNLIYANPIKQQRIVYYSNEINPALFILNPEEYSPNYIRNFSIIAHVDHGKSTLADRLLEITGTIPYNQNNKQVLDRLKVERDRGITVKAQTATMIWSLNYKNKDNNNNNNSSSISNNNNSNSSSSSSSRYLLNLVDTPGHVDFSYEVSRSLSACEGVLLVIDAQSGIQAQTVANFLLAHETNSTIIPVINKIDLKNANIDRCLNELSNVFGISQDRVHYCSAKLGTGVKDLIPAIINTIPPPSGSRNKPFRALLIDSWYEHFSGVICQIAMLDGVLNKGDVITFKHTQKTYTISGIGILRPNLVGTTQLFAGQIGYIIVGMKKVNDAKIGDTICHTQDETIITPLQGFRTIKPMVYTGLYPETLDQLSELENALGKLTLNDSSVVITPESSDSLGRGWKIGFLGRLHLEVFMQRLEEEFNASVILTSPSVPYIAELKQASRASQTPEVVITRASELPPNNKLESISEPFVLGTLIFPSECIGKMIELCMNRRGVQESLEYLSEERAILKFKLPLSEIITDFYGKLKSITSGYATFDYEECGYEISPIQKLDILINQKPIDAFSILEHKDNLIKRAKHICAHLKAHLTRQQFQIAIQGVVDGRVIARETIRAYKKDVTAKLHAADPSRHMKLLKRQQQGKLKMREIGKVPVTKELFINLVKDTL